MPAPDHDFRDALIVALIATVAVLPGVLPGAEYYVDNGPHVLEVQLLADEILPGEGWHLGWSDGANTGMAIGQLNAPLAWVPLALLVKLGLPVGLLTRLAGLFGNLVLSLGAWRLGRVLLVDRRAALVGAILAASSPIDLWGVGGAMGGMWPYRLANGLLLFGLAADPARRTAARIGAWLACILLLHTFTGQAAFMVAGLAGLAALWRRDWRGAAHLAGGAALALLVSAAFWVPLLDPALRGIANFWRTAPWELAGMLLVPIEVYGVRMQHELVVLGGGLGWAYALVLLGGAGFGLWRGQFTIAARPLARAVAVLVLLVAFMHSTGLEWMGPNPWRHLAHWRVALALAAGAGLTAMLPRSLPTVIAASLALTSLAIGQQQVPHRLRPDAASILANLEATWRDVAAGPDPGRVYQVDSFKSPWAPKALAWAHPGGVLAAEHRLDLVGSWYGVTPVPTVSHSASEAALMLGKGREAVTEDPGLAEWMLHRLRMYGVATVVTMDVPMGAALATHPGFIEISRHLPFAAFALAEPTLPRVGAQPPAVATSLALERGQVAAELVGEGPIPFRVRESYHPWWRATLDGTEIALSKDPRNGLIVGTAPGAGQLELQWQDRGRPWRWVSFGGLILLGLALLRSRRG